jgi:hypothetical protein
MAHSRNLCTSSAILTARYHFTRKRAFLWRFNVAGNNEMYSNLHALFQPNLEFLDRNIIFHRNLSRGSRTDTCEQTDGRRNSLIPFHSKRALLWRFNIAGNNKSYSSLHVKCPIILPDFIQIWVFDIFTQKSPT